MSTNPLLMLVLDNATALPSAVVPLNSCTVSPATAFVPLSTTCTVGVVSLVLPPFDTVPVTGATSSVTAVIVGAFGAVVSSATELPVAVSVLPAASVEGSEDVIGPSVSE